VSLKKKLILLLLISGIVLVFILYAGFGFTMLPSLKNQKDIFIKKLKKKIEVALSIEEDNITGLCKDFSNWDRLVEYINHPTEDFERDALPDAMFTDGMMDVVVILNAEGRILFYKNYRENEGFIGFNRPELLDDMKEINRQVRRKMGAVKGFIKTSAEPFMFVAAPVLNQRRLNRREGALLMGRYVDERMLKRVSFYSVEKILTLEFEEGELQSFCAEQKKLDDIPYRETEDKIMVFHCLKNIYGKLTTLLYTETDNRLFVVANRQIFRFSVISLVLILLIGVLIYFSVDKYLLNRMRSISDGMRRIQGFEDLSVRIDSEDGSRDEVSRLITDINLTLDRLEHEKIKRENVEKSMIKQGKLASIGRLASSIAHEINNPLVAISSSIQVLKSICKQREGEANPLVKEAMDITESETERIRHIISGLLDFHRLDKEEFSRVNLKDILLQSISIMNWTKKLGDIEIVTELKDDLFVFGAPVRLEQVFINFIANAAEAVASQGDGSEGGKMEKIRIQALLTEGPARKCAEVHFIDNGPGLSDNVKSSLFEPFVTTKDDKGVGLGLYISYKIVGNHGGEIVYDEDYKEGAHFIIRLPLDRRKEERIEVSLTPSP